MSRSSHFCGSSPGSGAMQPAVWAGSMLEEPPVLLPRTAAPALPPVAGVRAAPPAVVLVPARGKPVPPPPPTPALLPPFGITVLPPVDDEPPLAAPDWLLAVPATPTLPPLSAGPEHMSVRGESNSVDKRRAVRITA